MKKVFYRPDQEAVCADVIPFYEDGVYYMFYLRDYRNIEEKGEGCPWCLLSTKDFIHYEDKGPVLLRGTEEEQDLYVFTGCVIKYKDEYRIYYTGHNPHLRKQGLPEQKVLMAKSKDLIHWDKVKDFVMEAPSNLEPHDYRDPFVYYDEEKQKYGMLLAARFKNDNPTFSKGFTLVAYSNDLDNWEVADKPFYAPNSYFTHECPDLFKMGDWWYLVFSEFTDKIVTTYRMSKSIDGPWITPKINNFDGHAFYAAKSLFDGKRRIMLGWNCIKNHETDFEYWQWGGTIIPHELVQQPDGTLMVKCLDEIKNCFDEEISSPETNRLGDVTKTDNKYSLNGEGTNIVMFSEMPQICKIEMNFTTFDEIGDFGVILREQNNLDQFYKVKFEPKFNRLAYDIYPRKDNSKHLQVDVERHLELKTGQENKLIIIVQESVLEVYVNDLVAMSTRMFDYKTGNFGIYSHNTKVVFQNIKIFK